jgi:hypothetical protein
VAVVRYASGHEVLPGDVVRIDVRYKGTVVACIAEALYLPPHSPEQWGELKGGAMIDTDFGGLVHYPDENDLADDNIELISRREGQ